MQQVPLHTGDAAMAHGSSLEDISLGIDKAYSVCCMRIEFNNAASGKRVAHLENVVVAEKPFGCGPPEGVPCACSAE